MPHFAFIDIAASYTGASPLTQALGGTQAAVCHLSAALLRKGAQVTLINQNREEGIYAGIRSLPPEKLDDAQSLEDVDVLVMNGRWTKKLVQTLRGKTNSRLIGWMHEACFNDPWVLPLPEFDGFVFVSHWQKNINAPLIPPHANVTVIPNGIAPAFHTLFNNESILNAKQPIIVYMGGSKRGLFHLPQILPALKQQIPELTFEIYSDCAIDNDDTARHRMRETLLAIPGVTHVGVVSQRELPQRLKRASFFISPNTYPETFCICLAEAMAAGCTPIITARAALPETARGFGAMLPVELANSVSYEKDALDVAGFTTLTRQIIRARTSQSPGDVEAHLRCQIDTANAHYNWDTHADAWSQVQA
jgi:glycosyltransferase involved in cell wall biosynthesis